jgi:hypothetical protein
MKIRSICLALFMLGHAGGMCAQNSEAFTPIGQSAVATLHVPGFADSAARWPIDFQLADELPSPRPQGP